MQAQDCSRIHESEEDVALEDDEVAALEDADARVLVGSAEAEGTQVPSIDANAGDRE